MPLNTFDKRFDEYFEERTHPIFSDTNEFLGFVLVGRNVSETREIEDQFAKDKKLTAIGQISAGVAHDFNNTLTGVLGQVKIMKRQIEDPELLKHLEIIQKAANGGARTIRRIQDFTRTRPDLDFEMVELKLLIEDVVALTQPKWSDSSEMKGLIIEVVLNLPRNFTIMGNQSDLRNAFTNLIFNSVDAMPEGGIISITMEKMDNQILIQFKDTGVGMTEEVLDRIFDPFFTTKGMSGTGLGMTEVFGTVKRHRGQVHVESKVGEGTLITVTFPSTETRIVKATDEKPSENFRCKILIIDDEDYVLDGTRELLEDIGHEVTGFTSAFNALDHFKNNHYDVVITDLGMPEMSGQEVAEKIKIIKANTPVILLSGWNVNLKEEENLASVIDFTLTKPFSVESIQAVVSQATQLSKTEA